MGRLWSRIEGLVIPVSAATSLSLFIINFITCDRFSGVLAFLFSDTVIALYILLGLSIYVLTSVILYY